MTTTIRAFNIASICIDGPTRITRRNPAQGETDHFYALTIIATDESGHTTEFALSSDNRDALVLGRV